VEYFLKVQSQPVDRLDTTEDAIQKNILAAGYGNPNPVATRYGDDAGNVTPAYPIKVGCNPSNSNALISYALPDAGRVSMDIFDIHGRHITSIVDGVISAGRHEAVWNTTRVPAGVYMCRIAIDACRMGREDHCRKMKKVTK